MPDTQPPPQENRHHLLLVILFALSMLALLVISIILVAPEIEKDLNQKVTEELEKKGINATVTLSGRDVTLSGTVTTPEDIQHAQTSTTKICGIHFIDNQLVPHDKLTKTTHKSPLTTQNVTLKKQISPQTITNLTAPHTLPPSSIKIEERNANAIQEKPTKQVEKTKTAYSSSAAYEKILAAMSRYNKNKKIAATQENNNATQHKTAIDFDTSTIQFKKNTNSLTSSAKQSLVLLARQLKDTEKTIEIIVSSKKSDLAFNRAKKIQHYLIKQGLKKKHLIVIGRTSHTKETVTIVERET